MAFIPTIPQLGTGRPRIFNNVKAPTVCTTPIFRASAQSNSSRREFLLTFSIAATAISMVSSPAKADHTYVAAKRSYERYHPRILATIETLRSVRDAVKASDASGVANLIDDRQFDVKSRRALSIYATSFSDNYLGERSRAMLKSVNGLYTELNLVKKGVDMDVHYAKAMENLEDYYKEARLPMNEIAGLGI